MKALFCMLALAVSLSGQTLVPGFSGGGGGGGSITVGCGLSGTSPVIASEAVNAQTGTTYIYLTGDCGKLVTHTNGSAIAGTLPQASASFPAGWFMDVQNRGAGTLTITPTTSTIDGAASLDLLTSQGVRIVSDGTNYFTERGTGLMAGPGTTSGRFTAYELAANGNNFYQFRAPDSRATDLVELQPTADPTAGQTKAYSAPSSTVSTVTWVTPLVTGSTATFSGGAGFNLSPGSGIIAANTIQSFGQCTSAASPAVCGASYGGAVAIPAASATLVVNTSLVLASSEIHFQPNSSLGSRLGVTCNTTVPAGWMITAVTTNTSFTITLPLAPVTDPLCGTFIIRD